MTAYARPKESLFARAGKTLVLATAAAGLGYAANKFAPGAGAYFLDRPYCAMKSLATLLGDDTPDTPRTRGNRRVAPTPHK